MTRPLLTASLTSACVALCATQAFAATAPHSTAQEALRVAIDAPTLPGLKTLHARKGSWNGARSLERLPGGGWVAQVKVRVGARVLILPLKLQRQPIKDCDRKGWSVTWSPSSAYIQALLNVTTNDLVADLSHATSPAWSAATRMPTMPVILTRASVVTPWRTVSLAQPPETEGTLTVVKEVVVDANRWAKEILEGDQAPASLDVVADASVGWLTMQRVLMSAASAGFYKFYLIGHTKGALQTVEVNAAIFKPDPKHPPLIVAHAPATPIPFRMMYMRQPVPTPPCEVEKDCFATPDQFAASLKHVAGVLNQYDAQRKSKTLTHALFASTAGITLATALPLLARMPQALDIKPSALTVGFIQ